MTRIYTDQPSSGKPIQLLVPTNLGRFVSATTWTPLAEAPDFSIPIVDEASAVIDPDDNSRELRPGEIFIESPLRVTNTSNAAVSIRAAFILQGADDFPTTNQIDLIPNTSVPANSTILIPIQGMRLLKTNFDAECGQRLMVLASAGGALHVYASAVELEAAQHAPNSEE